MWYVWVGVVGGIVFISLILCIWLALSYNNLAKLQKLVDKRSAIVLRIKDRVASGEEKVEELDRVVELYNEAVYYYNRKVKRFPSKYVAQRFKMVEVQYFNPEATKDYVPKKARRQKK